MLLFYLKSLTRRRAIPVLLITLILVACTAHSPEIRTTLSSPTDSIKTYYNVQQRYRKIKIYYKLFFIRSLIKAGYLLQAKQQLAALPSLLDTSCQYEHQLLKAELALALHQPQRAYIAIQQIDRAFLDDSQRVRYSNIMITTGQSKPSLDLVRAYIHQEPLLQDDSVTHQQNIDSTWETLLLLPPNKINISLNDEDVLQGWLDLLSIYLNNCQDITILQKAIKNWQQTTSYTQHPAAKKLPTKLSKIKNYQPLSVGQIAMLLPLSGQATVFTNAIKQGFSSAHAGMEKQYPVPSLQETAAGSTYDHFPVTRFDRNVTVKIYDTTNNKIPALLAQANRNGARMIIGPLLKHEVEQLYNAETALIDKLNILALNQPEHLQLRPNICYFALTPEDEAREAANHIYQHGRRQPLLLLPRGTLGDRIATAFTDAWHHAGGGTVLAQRIGSTTELKQSINSGVGIKLTGMPVIGRDKLTNLPVTTTITSLTSKASNSKQDHLALYQSNNIDAVYIIATPDELWLIKPMIDMNISANARLALYASSRSYNYDAGPDYRLEMEGLEFSDIQLLTGINPALLAQTSAKCGGNYSLVRLYAMGMDAWMIAHNFNEMRYIPGFKVLGKTGTLSATPNCLINSKFSWFKYQQGKIIVIN